MNTIRTLGIALFVATTLAACSSGDEAAPTSERGLGKMSQALLAGSCSGTCGGQSPDGCWCDALCTGYGDCCTNKVLTCDSPTQFLKDYPPGEHNFWSDESQGVSHDGTSWYLAQNQPEPRVIKIPISFDLRTTNALANPPIAKIPASLLPVWETAADMQARFTRGGCWLSPTSPLCDGAVQIKVPGYHHVGDPDVYGQYLFVPLSGVGSSVYYGLRAAPPPLVAAYRTSDMSFVSGSQVCGATSPAKPDLPLSSGNGGIGWLATDSVRKLLFTSDNRIGPNNPMQVCTIQDAAIPGGDFLTFYAHTWLFDRTGGLMELTNMQGGDVSDAGTHIYLSNGYGGDHSGSDWGLRAFDITTISGVAPMIADSHNGLGPLGLGAQINPAKFGPGNFDFRWCDTTCGEEPEGVDYGQVFGAPNIPSTAFLHVVLLDNEVTSIDAVYLKHYAF